MTLNCQRGYFLADNTGDAGGGVIYFSIVNVRVGGSKVDALLNSGYNIAAFCQPEPTREHWGLVAGGPCAVGRQLRATGGCASWQQGNQDDERVLFFWADRFALACWITVHNLIVVVKFCGYVDNFGGLPTCGKVWYDAPMSLVML